MRMHKKNIENIERFNPAINNGLTKEQVELRKSQGLTNKTKIIAGKSTWEILKTNVFSFFNILLFIIAGLLIYGNINDGNPTTKWYSGLFFCFILISNIILGLYQDIKAKILMSKLKIVTTSAVNAIRDHEEVSLSVDEIVLDDVVIVGAGEQIAADSIIIKGQVSVNESMLTGESQNIEKKEGDILYAGSFITSGKVTTKVDAVGNDNYIQKISNQAKSFKRNPSHILKSLNRLFKSLGIIVISIEIVVLGTYAIMGQLNSFKGFVSIIPPTAGQMVAMIPSGLYLLTSFTLATGVLSLYKKKANVQDFYSIEMLARSDVLCVDKTGTITDGNMVVNEVVSLDNMKEEEVALVVSSIVNATGDNNVTAIALKNKFDKGNYLEANKVLAFNSNNKYSGASFAGGLTYLIGAPEMMNIKNKELLLEKSQSYAAKGYRVLLLAKGKDLIKEESYLGVVTPIALIVVQDHVKEDAKQTFEWFKENNVSIRVISGDNALTVSEIAKSAGIDGAERYISLDGMSLEEVKKIANDYVVFGRVTPEQKEALVIALKENGHTVAMCGDGVNDILALKRADCSIAMNSGSSSAKNVSHVVLLENNFSTMPDVVAQGRRVINNLTRTGSLFLVKTLFAMVMALGFFFVFIGSNKSVAYPFSTNNLLVWETFGIGLSAFFVSLEPDSKQIKRGFLRQILINAVPAAIMVCSSVLVIMLLYVFNKYGIMYTGINDFGFSMFNSNAPRGGATAISVMVFSILSIVALYQICSPLTKYRLVIVVGASLACILCFLIAWIKGGKNIFNINFESLTMENLMTILIVAIIIGAIYLFATYITKLILKERGKKDED